MMGVRHLTASTLSARLRGERVRAQRAGEVGRGESHLTLPIASQWVPSLSPTSWRRGTILFGLAVP